MFFERIGALFFSQLRPIFFYFLLLTPIVCATGYLYIQHIALSSLEESFYHSCKKGKSALEKKAKKENFIQRYSHASPYFLDEMVESLTFLNREREELEILAKHPALADKKPIESRLSFLSHGNNRLFFTEEEIRLSSTMKETEERQQHPVQMDATDVKRTLALLEDIPIESFSSPPHRPQCMITDFRLEQKQSERGTPFFEIEMQFIKRECIQ